MSMNIIFETNNKINTTPLKIFISGPMDNIYSNANEYSPKNIVLNSVALI